MGSCPTYPWVQYKCQSD